MVFDIKKSENAKAFRQHSDLRRFAVRSWIAKSVTFLKYQELLNLLKANLTFKSETNHMNWKDFAHHKTFQFQKHTFMPTLFTVGVIILLCRYYLSAWRHLFYECKITNFYKLANPHEPIFQNVPIDELGGWLNPKIGVTYETFPVRPSNMSEQTKNVRWWFKNVPKMKYHDFFFFWEKCMIFIWIYSFEFI